MSETRQKRDGGGRRISSMITTTPTFTGIDTDELDRVLATGVDHGGNMIDVFDDPDGGWPLRCCLTDSEPGDRIAIIAWSPFDWDGPYRETGPVVVHADGCSGATTDALSDDFDSRPMVLRPYGPDHRIAYDLVRHIPEGGSLTHHVSELLNDVRVDMVHGRNVTGGCYSFTARRT